MLYNLKSTISNTSFKHNSGNISFSQQSSTQQIPATILEEIEYLENENKKLKNIISNIKATEKTEHQRRIKQLKKITPNHGCCLRKQINNLTTNLNNFLTHLQLCNILWKQNTALILVHQNQLHQQSLLHEQDKLSTTNKVHNFTSINLPSELTMRLNKGTNFIPTLDKIDISTLKKTISSEINSTLCQVIKKEPKTTAPAAHTPIKSSKGKTISDTNLTSQGNQSSSFKNNNLNLTLIYISLIMFMTQHHTQNST